jgi:hypothetical protein
MLYLAWLILRVVISLVKARDSDSVIAHNSMFLLFLAGCLTRAAGILSRRRQCLLLTNRLSGHPTHDGPNDGPAQPHHFVGLLCCSSQKAWPMHRRILIVASPGRVPRAIRDRETVKRAACIFYEESRGIHTVDRRFDDHLSSLSDDPCAAIGMDLGGESWSDYLDMLRIAEAA